MARLISYWSWLSLDDANGKTCDLTAVVCGIDVKTGVVRLDAWIDTGTPTLKDTLGPFTDTPRFFRYNTLHPDYVRALKSAPDYGKDWTGLKRIEYTGQCTVSSYEEYPLSTDTLGCYLTLTATDSFSVLPAHLLSLS